MSASSKDSGGTTTRWVLTRAALDLLLARLSRDSEAAGAAYQALRTRLADYFDWKGVRAPEDAADETLDRVARRLEEGQAVDRIGAYAYGVARLVVLERLRHQRRERRSSAAAAERLQPAEEQDRSACLGQCLQELPPEERALIVGYYEGAGRSHLEGRKLQANRLGIPYTTLRTRAHRIRQRLVDCLRDCLEKGAGQR